MGPRERTDRPEEELQQRLVAGDVEALARLFETYVPVIAARVRRLVPASILRRVSVSDVLQEVRIVAMEQCREFEDRGPGVATQELASLFEPFYRAGSAGAAGSPGGGAGLGLSIAQAAIAAHKGSISARNVAPQGLSVRMDLPLLAASQA